MILDRLTLLFGMLHSLVFTIFAYGSPKEAFSHLHRDGSISLQRAVGGLSDHMEVAQEIANGFAQAYPEYEAMAEAARSAAEIVMTAYEPEAYGQRESDDQ